MKKKFAYHQSGYKTDDNWCWWKSIRYENKTIYLEHNKFKKLGFFV